jgi:hypothetical protein
MQEMICVSDIEYPPGKMRKPGDKFEVEENDVKVLQVVGRAKLADEGYLTRDMTAAGPADYNRRDIPMAPLVKRKRGRPRKVLT